MIPKLYDSFGYQTASGARDFLRKITHCTKCYVTESTDGEYTLDLETTVNDPAAPILLSQRIIAIKPNPHDPIQHFEIQSTERSTDGIIKLSAKHVKNFVCQLVSEGDIDHIGPATTYNLTPQGVWNKLFNDGYITSSCPFTFTSDITAKADCYLGFNEPVTLGDILGGADGSMLDMFGGEFYYNNYAINFRESRGNNTNYSLRYGKNITNAKQQENCLQAYSHILPYGTVVAPGGASTRLMASLYAIPNNECKTMKVLPLDCSEAVEGFEVGQAGAHYAEARALMTSFAARYASNNNIGKVEVSIDVTARADLDSMQQLGLCDTVKVVLDEFGTTTRAKITSVTYDALLERWVKMTVGTSSLKLADIILDRRRFNI